VSVRITVIDERRGRFARLREKHVLIYWPHGLGDFAHLATILPFLERSNRYAIVRYGDDYTSLLDANPYVRVVHTGARRISNGSEDGSGHLGIDFKGIDGRERTIAAPLLESAIAQERFDVLLYTDYPEREGRTKYPFHTKARALLRDLVDRHNLDMDALARPLPSTLDFSVDPRVRSIVDERVRSWVAPGERLLLLCATGHSADRKNWAQAQRFAAIAAGESPRMRVLSFPQDFAKLFGDVDVPFALLLKALTARADACAGVPAGPLHVALAHTGTPVVGIWHAHHPDWYEEPNTNAIHLLGRDVIERGFDRRPATRTLPPELRNRTMAVAQSQVPAEDAWEAVRSLLR
jgi:hypothetical protein